MKMVLTPFDAEYTDKIEEMIAADRKSGMMFGRLFRDMQQNSSLVFADGKLAGILLKARSGSVYYRMVYIDPEMRRKGIGRSVMCMEEKNLANDAEKLTSFYDISDSAAAAFAESLGYRRTFDSTYMEYTGGRKTVGTLPVRKYRDADYFEAHRMYAEAFHRMRVQVGDFPNSVPVQPSEKGRLAWENDAENYLLYVEDGAIVGVGHLYEDEISSVSVHVDRQKQGIGSRLVPYLINVILDRGYSAVHLECVVGNPARKLYDRLGFVPLYTQRFAEKTIR